MRLLSWVRWLVVGVANILGLVLHCSAQTNGASINPGSNPGPQPIIKVGVASVDISTSEPIWLGGWHQRKQASQGVFEKIYANCIVFDNGKTRVGMLSVDVPIVLNRQADAIRSAAEKLGIPRANMIVNMSHTHSGPDMDTEVNANKAYLRLAMEKGATKEECIARNKPYLKEFEEKAILAIQTAISNLSEARLDSAVGSCTMGISRRQLDDSGKAVGMKPEPRKPIDLDVPVLRVLSPKGEVRAVLFSYACHPSVFVADELSSDYVGAARDWIGAAYPGSISVFLQGCGGDVKPRGVKPNGSFGVVLLDVRQTCLELGHELGRAAVAAVCVSPEPVAGVENQPMPMCVMSEKVLLPKKDPARTTDGIELSAVRIGNHYFMFSQREICVEIGLRIKRELADWARQNKSHVWTCGYSHGGGGYIPASASYREGGYEVDISPFNADAEDVVVKKTIELIKASKDSNSP